MERRASFTRNLRSSNPELDNSQPLIIDNESGGGVQNRPSFKDDSYLIDREVYFNREDVLE